MPVTLKDIADEVGKSITTVSRALNGYNDVSSTTRDFIVQKANEMGYFPNTFAQRLQKQRTDLLGVILPVLGPRSTDMFLSEFLAGVGAGAKNYGCDLLVALQHPGQEELRSYQHMVKSQLVDGFILTRTRRDDARIKYLTEQKVPFVCYGRTKGKCHFPFIDVDGEQAIYKITEHLIELGHHRIACIASVPFYNFSTYRLNGFKRALKDHQISLPRNYIRIGDLLQESGYREASYLLDLPNRPTAIVAFNDMMAFGCFLAAQERNLRIPEDLSITGYDDISLSATTNPPLTTLYQPIYEIGERLGKLLIGLVRGEYTGPTQLWMNTSLIKRESTGTPDKPLSLIGRFPVKKKKLNEYESIKASLSPWVVEEVIDGFGIASQLDRVEKITFECNLTRIIFPNRAGELIEDIGSLPKNFNYSLTYPGTASTKSMVLYFGENEGLFIGAKMSAEFARIDIRKIYGSRCQITFQSKDNQLLFLPFQGSWKQVLPFFRDYYSIPSSSIPYKQRTYLFQIGIRSPEGYSELSHFSQLIEPLRLIARRYGHGHIIHFYGVTQTGYLRGWPDYTLSKEQGGERAFRNTIKALQSLGFRVSTHYNPRLADYDWVQQNKVFRSDIVRDDRDHPVIETVDGHPYYVMNPTSRRWFDKCLTGITEMHKMGFDLIQLAQFTHSPNFRTRSDVIHEAYHRLTDIMHQQGIQYWISGLSDLYSSGWAEFTQYLRKPGQMVFANGEPRGIPIYGTSFPEFFTSLFPDVKLAYPVLSEEENWEEFDNNFTAAKDIRADVYDIQIGYYRKNFQMDIQKVIDMIDRNL